MQTRTRRLAWAVLTLVVMLVLLALCFALWPTRTRSIADTTLPAAGSPELARLVEAGRYVATASDCVACHSRADGSGNASASASANALASASASGSTSERPSESASGSTEGSAGGSTSGPSNATAFSGGLPLASPIGVIYSTNITPDRNTGIGSYSLDDFDRAIRHGIAQDGRTLYPAMPYPSYARLSNADLVALYAFFMHGVQPVVQANRPTGIAWPLSMRWPLAIWRKLFGGGFGGGFSGVFSGGFGGATDAPPTFDAAAYGGNAQVARGAYLVQGPGHCGACHTARAITFQERGLDERSADYLAGGQVVDGWVAVNLRGDSADGLGRWSLADIVATLRGARNRNQAVVGGAMQDVVVHSTQHLRDADLQAMAVYLKTLPPATAAPRGAPRFTPDERTARALALGQEDGRGAQLYIDNCAHCHRTNGLGHADVFPSIAGNPTVLAPEPTSLIRLVLAGSSLPGTAAAPSPLGMPSYAGRMSDDEVAQLLSFIRQGWGNQAGTVGAGAVAKVRRQLAQEAKQGAQADVAKAQGGTRSPGVPDKR